MSDSGIDSGIAHKQVYQKLPRSQGVICSILLEILRFLSRVKKAFMQAVEKLIYEKQPNLMFSSGCCISLEA